MAIEARLMFYSQYIVRCIKDPRVISHLAADLTIPHDECSKLKKILMGGDSFKANEMMIDSLLKSTERGKWQSLLTALENSEYGYIKSLLETGGKPDLEDERGGAIIRVYTPYLEKNVAAMDIVTELYSRKVLNDMDLDMIRANYQNMGNTYATSVLLERMQCRLAPDEWFKEFLDVLIHKNLKHIVEEIEPDYLLCPDKYQQSKVLSTSTVMDCERAMALDEEEPTCSTSYDIQEHVLTGYGEASEKMDEGVPEPFDDDFEKNTDDLPVDLTMKGTSEQSSCKDDMIKYPNTQDTLIDTRQSGDMNTTKKLESATLGIRTPPEGRDVDCKDSVGVDKAQTVNKHKLSNNIFHPEMGTHIGSDELVGCNSKITPETQSESDHGTGPLAEKLYPFQHELAEKALAGKNTIICAPTGSGKTWVATHIIDSHLNSTAIGKNKRRVAFMARNGVLVKQQMDFISQELTYAHVKHIEGNTEESMMLNAILEDFDIFLFTPQILVNNLNSDIKSLSVFSLLVFDECHHAKGNEPYNVLMRHYLVEKSKGNNDLPQVVGLTASIGTGRAKSEDDALNHIFRVCASLDVRCLSTVEKHKEDLAKHCSVPREEKILMKNRTNDPCRSILLEAVKKTADVLADLALMEPKLIPVMHKCPKHLEAKGYELWIASVINAAESLSGDQFRDITTCAKYLQIYYNALEINRPSLWNVWNVYPQQRVSLLIPQCHRRGQTSCIFHKRLVNTNEDIAIYLAKKHESDAQNPESLTNEESKLLKCLKDVQKELNKEESENPNVHVISEIIKGLFTGKDADVNSRVMVFVHARATCRALSDFLNDELDEIYVKASPFIGKENRGTDKGMTEEEQTQILEEFKEGTFKVLVATSIGMEGLDVPDCNMTLNYNFNGNEITKIQMSGRSRKDKGTEVHIGTEDQFAKDSIVMYRIKLMNEAIERFKALDENSINRKVVAAQKKTLDDFEWELKIKELKRSKQSVENDFEIQCRRCGTFVCNTSNLRQLDTSFLVALKDFNEKIIKKPHKKRANMGALQKTHKMFCKECPNDWGVIAMKNEIEYFVLKLASLKFICSDDHKSATFYKKWSDVPYKPKELSTRDLDDMYNDS